VWLGSGVGNVAVWYDQSGRGNNATQSTTTWQPVYNVAGQYVDFAGSKWMSLQASSFSSGNGQYSYVVKHGSFGTTSAAFSLGTSITNQLQTFFINYGYQEKQPDFPDFIVSSLAEVAEIIIGEFS
jgi:hypothetical protein